MPMNYRSMRRQVVPKFKAYCAGCYKLVSREIRAMHRPCPQCGCSGVLVLEDQREVVDSSTGKVRENHRINKHGTFSYWYHKEREAATS